MKKIKLKILFTAIFMLLMGTVSAQTMKISGKVTDSEGQPLVGATVVIKGTPNYALVADDGSYSINTTKDDILVFSFVGYKTEEVLVSDQTVINIFFEDNILDDIVIIGYGTVRKKDMTGAVSSISEKDFVKGGSSLDRLIVGKVAGVQISPNGGAPGSGSRIRIRGGSSLTASNDPLIIVDGIPLENNGVSGSPSLLSTINPNDIETMNVLKDASATAIYGSRASNGVIIITTKKAKSGQKLDISFGTQASISTISKKLDVLTGDQVRDIVNNYPKSNDDFRSLLGTANTDWQDEIFQNAFGTDNNLSIAGSVADIPFRVSLGYLNEDGILRTGNMERMTGGLNLNPRFFNDHLKVDISLKGTRVNNRFANTSAIATATAFDPTQQVKAPGFEDYGGYFTWLFPDSGELNGQGATNPVLMLESYKNTSNVNRGIVTAQFDYKMHFLPELRANLNLGYDYSDGKGHIYVPEWVPYMLSRKGQDTDYSQTKKNKLFEYYMNYAKEFKQIKSYLDVTAGYTYQDWLTHTDNHIDYTATGEEYNVPDYPYDEPRVTLLSTFGRLNYTLMDKYLLTATVRRDGSSRFHPDNRWGTFPSFALAWRMNEEKFLNNTSWLSDLKLRLGYGQTGQQDIYEYYPYLSRYEMSSNNSQYLFGDKYYYMARPSAYDEGIKWETTTTYNVALDYGFLNNRVNGSIDFYLKKTSDLLNRVDVPAGTNFSNQIITNIGNLENKGVEFTLNAIPIQTKDWNWNVSFNAAFNKNKITKLTLVESDDYEGVQAGWITGSTGETVQIHSVGYNAYSFYLYKQAYDENGNPLEGVYADLNDDGVINGKDKYRTKSAEPKVTMGFSSTLNYKNWSLSTVLRASIGNYMYNNVNSNYAKYSTILNSTRTIVNAPTSVLQSNFYLSQPLSDYYLENASFLKMDNLTLGYDFGRVFNNAVSIRGTLGIQNVFTITKYSGTDPEISGGVDRDFYPRPRTFLLGFNLNF